MPVSVRAEFLQCTFEECAFSDYELIDGTVPSSMRVLPTSLEPKCPRIARGHYCAKGSVGIRLRGPCQSFRNQRPGDENGLFM
ncbi:hypothetical protein EYF80_026766 [Liparis tanakae]|uniref:Uncharacterized protein n=1 Tax=Liparis tanakae TaxID=230148 RepID=A0A4Z2HAY4_9TELE|nr:hypothetical protein EYF80_026766 [Liparis tanakae]